MPHSDLTLTSRTGNYGLYPPLTQTPGHGSSRRPPLPCIGLDQATSMFAPCLLGCRGTARQYPAAGGTTDVGLPHKLAGTNSARHQTVSKRAVRELTSFSSLVLRKAGWLEVRRRVTGAAV